MTELQKIYTLLSNQKKGNQKKVQVDSCLEVFFGFNFDSNLRLSFLSKETPPVIESTKILHVVQGRENSTAYWTSIDLLDADLKEAYLSFCDNLISSVIGINDEKTAMDLLKRRFSTWKNLFKKSSEKSISKENLLGLFGELLVLKRIIAPKYGLNAAIKSWGGPNMQSKDFTVNNTWYEVKTIGANTDMIHISSLTQLSSDNLGHLAVVRVETVSPEFNGDDSSISEIIREILLKISDEDIEKLFVQKIQETGIDVFEKEITFKFDVKSIELFCVGNDFPRITQKNVPYSEITNVSYVISASAIDRFAEK